ncbi:MAG: hypothetical protein LBM71_01500 [Elusimicrobiota bacterium]|jgi:hypothetical protein|nr:hypothetical protein [Elusimicrobiota bacterium]
MDYLIARWFVVKNLDAAKLKALHNFERAVKEYSLNNKDNFNKSKIIAPLWWQEGAIFLSKDFKAFWAAGKNNPAKTQAFILDIKTLLGAKFNCKNKSVQNPIVSLKNKALRDINFMHKCDLAINASTQPRQLSGAVSYAKKRRKASQPQPAKTRPAPQPKQSF